MEIRYQVRASQLGWNAHYQAGLQDLSLELTSLLNVVNELDIPFVNANIVFSTHQRSDNSTKLAIVTGSNKMFSSLSSFKSSGSKKRTSVPKGYVPAAEYFLTSHFKGDVIAITLPPKSDQELTLHTHQTPFNVAEGGSFFFDACTSYPSPGIIHSQDSPSSMTVRSSSLPFVASLANTAECGFGLDFPAGDLEVYAISPALHAAYSLQGPLSQLTHSAPFSASETGGRLFIELPRPPVSLVSCSKERKNFRSTRGNITENFIYTIENEKSLVPINVTVFDCAFRHDRVALRLHPADVHLERIGRNFFSLYFPQIPFRTKLEVNLTLEYTFN